jgi:hypothetical protein
MSAEDLWGLLYDEYLPFRLHAEHKNGVSVQQLASTLGLSAAWVEERIEAARVCIEQQGRIPKPWIPSEFHSDVKQ